MMETLLLGLVIQAFPATDTAYLEGERLLVQPIGITFRVPPVWLGNSPPKGRDYPCGNPPSGTVSDRIVTEPGRFRSLQRPGGEWKAEFAAVVDSVLPFRDLVAHLGGDPWNGNCGAMQMRVYVGDHLAWRTIEALPGVRSARRYFKPVHRTQVDSAGWGITRLSWNAWYTDYGGPATVEFWSRSFGGRDLVLVFMFSGYDSDQFLDRTDIIQSIGKNRRSMKSAAQSTPR
jgi:hypothetical protein